MATNKLHAIGRLTGDPELKTLGNTTAATFSLASDTRNKTADGKVITNFYRCTVWGKQADTICKYTHKGDKLSIIGDLVLREYTDRNGAPRISPDVSVSDFEFLSAARNGETTATAAPAQPASTQTYTPVTDPDDLPF